MRVVGRAPGRDKDRGYVVTLKEGFGFIETSDHEREIYFHFRSPIYFICLSQLVWIIIIIIIIESFFYL